MIQARQALTDATSANDFISKMKISSTPKLVKATMMLREIQHSLELAQALAAGDQLSFLKDIEKSGRGSERSI